MDDSIPAVVHALLRDIADQVVVALLDVLLAAALEGKATSPHSYSRSNLMNLFLGGFDSCEKRSICGMCRSYSKLICIFVMR